MFFWVEDNFENYVVVFFMDDIIVVCEFFEIKKVEFKKWFMDGKFKLIVFIVDLDGYWIEVI